MSKTLEAICVVLLGGTLLCGCKDGSRAGCTNSDIVLFDQQCLTSDQCPDCGPICENQGGTRVGGPSCVLEIGFGFFCQCTCEFCVDGGAGGADGGTGGNDGGSAQ